MKVFVVFLLMLPRVGAFAPLYSVLESKKPLSLFKETHFQDITTAPGLVDTFSFAPDETKDKPAEKMAIDPKGGAVNDDWIAAEFNRHLEHEPPRIIMSTEWFDFALHEFEKQPHKQEIHKATPTTTPDIAEWMFHKFEKHEEGKPGKVSTKQDSVVEWFAFASQDEMLKPSKMKSVPSDTATAKSDLAQWIAHKFAPVDREASSVKKAEPVDWFAVASNDELSKINKRNLMNLQPSRLEIAKWLVQTFNAHVPEGEGPKQVHPLDPVDWFAVSSKDGVRCTAQPVESTSPTDLYNRMAHKFQNKDAGAPRTVLITDSVDWFAISLGTQAAPPKALTRKDKNVEEPFLRTDWFSYALQM